MKENASDFYTQTCLAKYDLLVDPFVVTNQAKHQDYSGIFNRGRHSLAEVTLEFQGSF